MGVGGKGDHCFTKAAKKLYLSALVKMLKMIVYSLQYKQIYDKCVYIFSPVYLNCLKTAQIIINKKLNSQTIHVRFIIKEVHV